SQGKFQIYVRDVDNARTRAVSISALPPAMGDGDSTEPSISADGKRVAFTSAANDLVADETNGKLDVFLRAHGATTRMSVTYSGAEATNGDSITPAISGNGLHVAFDSLADNLPGATAGRHNVYVRDV